MKVFEVQKVDNNYLYTYQKHKQKINEKLYTVIADKIRLLEFMSKLIIISYKCIGTRYILLKVRQKVNVSIVGMQ